MDYQASTPVDPRVIEAMRPYLGDKPGNPHGEHAFAWEAHAAIDRATQQIATELGCDADEVVFTSGATESNNLAILGAAARAPSNRKRILISAIEHKCVIEAAAAAGRRHGMTIETLPVDGEGLVSIQALKDRLADDVLLVSIMAANNEIGTMQPISALAAASHDHGAIFHSDGTQALSAGRIEVFAQGIDLMSFSSHKVYGPKGIGALYVSREYRSRLEPLIYGGGQQGGLRAGTLPVQLCVGFGAAVELMGTERALGETVRVARFRDRLVAGILERAPEARPNGPNPTNRHPANANVRFPGYDARDLLDSLQPALAVSTGSACTSGEQEPSHVLRAIGLSNADAQASLRLGVGRFTTEQEIDEAIGLVAEGISRAAYVAS